ncbi:MAG: carbon-nitrogen hydrolase family protein [Polyangiaceae bacterium]
MSNSLRVAAVQLNSRDDVELNLRECAEWVHRASDQGAKLVVLPENFAFFGPEEQRRRCAESVSSDGPIVSSLKRMASEYGVHLLGGGWPERSHDETRPYNAATLIDPNGRIVAHYRKIHLFDVTLPSGATLMESSVTTAGDSVVVADVEGVAVGLTICYDLRFPELYRALVDRGAELICVPAAFTAETGRDHWHLLNRARAVESQCWVVSPNQWGQHGRGRQTYGHSIVVDPWGTVVADASDQEGLVVALLDFDWLRTIRERLPSLKHRRLGLGGN